MTADGAKHQSQSVPGHGDLWNGSDRMEARLSAVESGLREVQNSMRLWSGIVQDGLADLSVEIQAVKQWQRRIHQLHLDHEKEDVSDASERLVKAQEEPELGQRMSKFEQQMREMHETIQKLQFKQLHDVREDRNGLNQTYDMLNESWLRLPQSPCTQHVEFHPVSLSDPPVCSDSATFKNAALAAPVLCDPLMTSSRKLPGSIESSPQPPLRRLDGVLQSQMPCSPQQQPRTQLQLRVAQLLQLQRGMDSREQVAAHPLAGEATDCTQQHSRVLEGMHSRSTQCSVSTWPEVSHQPDTCTRQDVKQEVMARRVIPGRQQNASKEDSSGSVQLLRGQHARILVQPCLHAASTPVSPLIRTRCTADLRH